MMKTAMRLNEWIIKHKWGLKVIAGILMLASGWLIGGIAYTVAIKTPGINLLCFIVGPTLFIYGIRILVNNKEKFGNIYYANGILKFEAIYSNNDKTILARYYYESGVLKKEIPYTNEKIDGVKKEYYESGKIMRESHYVNGNLGVVKNYDEDGNEVK
ncbi:MAG TPA: hypothetical protein VN922_14670 [Bacteroidia bacterium]|nr:hypothetical protein [Bacteroidia bacterium]